MAHIRKFICFTTAVLLILSLVTGCNQEVPIPSSDLPQQPIIEHYEYASEEILCLWPSMVERWVNAKALVTYTEDGTFYCCTEDSSLADAFVYSERTLLNFLRENGVGTVKMTFYATSYDDSFSESREKTAYVAMTASKTWRQVLVTLQTLWGDFVDYGYIYALSNAIAAELGWETDPVPQINRTIIDAFFQANPEALQLLFPSFSSTYASEETVSNCKAVSTMLFEKIDLSSALQKSLNAQLSDYYRFLDDYAADISVSVARQSCGYAYYGQRIPLRIQTKYAEHYVDAGYTDYYRDHYGDYFCDYVSIYEMANHLDQETTATVVSLGLEEDAEAIRINWMSQESVEQKYPGTFKGEYILATESVNLARMDIYMYEYARYLENLLNPDTQNSWQVQAFCDLVASNTKYYWYGMTETISKSPVYIELVSMLSDSPDLSGRDFYNEINDILCYINGFALNNSNYNTSQSMARYLVDVYGKTTAMDILLHPDKVTAVTGKTWDALADEWEQMIRAKYDGKPLPDSVK